jgi:uncharacterized protein (TIGR00725 family)
VTHGPYVAVVGAGVASPDELAAAEEVGRGLAAAGAVVVTGGLGGVMEAASRGAATAGGLVVGLLPGADRAAANRWVGVALPTGLGEGRNLVLVGSADVVVAIGGEWGTLSEIALALKAGTPVVGLGTWDIEGIMQATDARDAVTRVIRHTSSAVS